VIVIAQQGDKIIARNARRLPEMLFCGSCPGLTSPGGKTGLLYHGCDKLEIAAGQQSPIEVKLQPVREYKEEIEVTAQPSPIDPEETSSAQAITASDISSIPYPHKGLSRRAGLHSGRGGRSRTNPYCRASTQEIQDYLDGFEVSQPASGALSVRLNPDSLRKIDVRSSRYSAQFGKGSGGLVDLQVQDGDNRFRVNATDFVPTFQNVKASISITGRRGATSPVRCER